MNDGNYNRKAGDERCRTGRQTTHKGEEPKEIVPQGTATGQQQQPTATQRGPTTNQVRLEQTASIDHSRAVTSRAKKRKPVVADSGTPRVLAVAEVAIGWEQCWPSLSSSSSYGVRSKVFYVQVAHFGRVLRPDFDDDKLEE